jgi:flagellum-specific peptidoglycan hydrolase FlgJ
MQTVVVQIGDNLPAIAQRTLGDASRWPEIFYLNKDQIYNPDVILPGMLLKLPKGPKPAQPPPLPPARSTPKPQTVPTPTGDPQALKGITPEQLAYLGANDKKKFFEVLKPAAIESEQTYGVPWQLTLAQVALESGWGRSPSGSYNLFGIKGKGPAGSTQLRTREWRNGQYVSEMAGFARYHNFYEAVKEHGKLFHNGYYKKAINAYASGDRDPRHFAQNIHGIYATSPTYAKNLISIMEEYHLI